MSKQKITEQELLAKIAKLQEQMDQSVEEGWWGDNMPELLGGDKAKAPMKVAVTPKNYARVQKMLPAMYAAAKVDPNADEIVKQRFGVYLPPIEKWDGTVPSGRGDFMTRNVFGRDGAAAAEAEGTKAQQAEVERQQRIETNAKKLTTLSRKLKELVPAAFAKQQDILDPEDRRHADAAVAAAVAGPPPVKESLAESMKRLSLMITEQEQPAAATPAAASGETPAVPAGHPADEVIKEIEATIAAIEADDPDEDDLQMIAAVKEKVAQCQAIIQKEAEAAKAAPTKDNTAQAEINAQIEKDKQNPQNDPIAAQIEKDKQNPQNNPAAAVPGAPPVTDAKKFVPLPWKEIYDLNKSIIGNDPNLIKPGQKFELPNGMGSYTVVPGDNLSRIAAGQGLGKYETNVPPAQPSLPAKPPAPQFTPKIPFKKELPKELNDITTIPKSTTGTYQHLDVKDPKIKAMQAAADKDPNNASFRTTVQEDQTLARIVSLVNYNK